MTTNYFKSHGENKAETMTETNANGDAWEIRTSKGNRGQITCTAYQCKDNGSGMYSYDMFGGKQVTLASGQGMATEKKIKEVHAAGLLEWEKVKETLAPAAPAYVIGIGQVLFTDGLESERRRAVYAIDRPGRYRTVLLTGEGMDFDEHVVKYGERQGIGCYYNEGDIISAEEVARLHLMATETGEIRRASEEQQKQQAAQERADKIAQGAKVLQTIPDGVAAVLVAHLRSDDSDPMSDYFNYKTMQTIYLAWSAHERDLFPEMRKAAAKFEGTAQYVTAPETAEGNTPADEHRKKYSMGSGYYLGESKYSGWIVEKEKVGAMYGVKLETLQIAIAEGRYYCGDFEAAPAVEPVTPVAGGTVQIIDYSERAFAVIGDTKPIKDKLSELGGKFNGRLSCGPGWIFSKKRLQQVSAALKGTPAGEAAFAATVVSAKEYIPNPPTPQVPAPWSKHGERNDTAYIDQALIDNYNRPY